LLGGSPFGACNRGLGFAGVSSFLQQPQPQKERGEMYEYKVVPMGDVRGLMRRGRGNIVEVGESFEGTLQEALDYYAQEGWRLVAYHSERLEALLIFERQGK
jgi:hypothetical protein